MDIKHKLKLLTPLLLYAVFYIAAFALLEKIDRTGWISPSLEIDDMIPFVPVFIIPYVSWFVWVPFVCGLLLISDEENYIRTERFLIIGMTVFLIFSAIIPTKLHLRPDIIPDTGISGFLLNTIYSADTSTNVFPSIHVYNSCVVWHAVLTSDEWLFRQKWFRAFTTVQAILIILSTMLVKQHSVIDVVGAFLLFAVVLILDRHFLYITGQRKSKTEGEK